MLEGITIPIQLPPAASKKKKIGDREREREMTVSFHVDTHAAHGRAVFEAVLSYNHLAYNFQNNVNKLCKAFNSYDV